MKSHVNSINRHYTKPLVPDIRNLNLFKGYILHSRDYRKPNSFKGKRVVVLGAGPSAVDISIELLNVASKVWHYIWFYLISKFVHVLSIFNGERALFRYQCKIGRSVE